MASKFAYGAHVTFRRLERMAASHPLRKFGSQFSMTVVAQSTWRDRGGAREGMRNHAPPLVGLAAKDSNSAKASRGRAGMPGRETLSSRFL